MNFLYTVESSTAHMNNLAKTKIVATIGPSSWDETVLRNMHRNGMQLARINASFADFEELDRVASLIRKISPRISLILDTQGTKIRVKGLEKDIDVKDSLVISSNEKSQGIKITYPNLHKHLNIGNQILLDDGNIELKVTAIEGEDIVCEVIQGGILKPNKTVNIPSMNLVFPTLTEKDKEDIGNAMKLGYDFVCLSFVRDKNDVLAVKELLEDSSIKIISKIENQLGLDSFDEILKVSDAIMIARGDLGVETPLEDVPILQKRMIYQCRAAGKPVIVATQMLESMRENIRPTRAEVSDVANAVMDGADALMLSAETSTGKNPVQAVEYMNRIALKAESVMQLSPIYGNTEAGIESDAIAKNACFLTQNLDINSIIVLSESSATVGSVTRHRPNVPIYSVSSSIKKVKQHNLYKGVKTFYIEQLADDRDQAIAQAVETIYTHGELDLRDKIAIITGSSIKDCTSDSILEIVTVKDILD